MERLKDFSEVKGHDSIVDYLTAMIANKSLPHFLIFEGDHGCGKTSLALLTAIALNYGLDSSAEKTKAIESIIVNNKSTECVKLFDLSVEKGVKSATEIRDELKSCLTSTGIKVLIGDEAHHMSTDAQEMLTIPLEHIREDTYVIWMTTDISNLAKSIKSRAFKIPIKTLKIGEVQTLIQQKVTENRLIIQGGDASIRLIAEWSGGHVRDALSLIDGLGSNREVRSSFLKELIKYMEVGELLEIIGALTAPISYGLTLISNMKYNESLIRLLVEVLQIKLGNPSTLFSQRDVTDIRRALIEVPEESLETLICELSENPRNLLGAFVKSHVRRGKLDKHSDEVLKQEDAFIRTISDSTESMLSGTDRPFSIDELVQRGVKVR